MSGGQHCERWLADSKTLSFEAAVHASARTKRGSSMSTQNVTQDLKKRSTWSILMGILTALLGGFLIAYPLATATVTTVLLGWVLIFVAIAEFVFALHSPSVGKFFLKVFLGLLYGIVGVALAFYPFSGVAALTVFIGTLLLVYGIVGLVG